MKTLIMLLIVAMLSGTKALAAHRCAVAADIQVYDAETLQFKRVERGVSDFFDVSSQPHEEPKSLVLRGASGANGAIGTASVWTGTLLGTSEGDVIQAHASFKIKDQSGDAALAFSFDSRFSSTTVVLETTAGGEYFLMPVDLKCTKIQ